MDMKWIDRSYQFDDDLGGGGGGDPAPAPEPTPAAPPEPTPEPAPDPTGDEPAPAAAVHVAMPEGLGGLFAPAPAAPAAPPQTWTPPAGPHMGAPEPPKAPPKADFPDGDDWIADPGKAAKQQAAAILYANWESQAPLRNEISSLRQGVEGMQEGDFNAISQRVNASIDQTENTVNSFYSEKGALNADPEFRNNPELQKSVEGIIKACVISAINVADRTGKTLKLERIQDPKFPYRALALAKADAKNVPEGALRPGASPVGPQPPSPPSNEGLSAEDSAALKAARAEGVNLTAADIKRARKLTKQSIY